MILNLNKGMLWLEMGFGAFWFGAFLKINPEIKKKINLRSRPIFLLSWSNFSKTEITLLNHVEFLIKKIKLFALLTFIKIRPYFLRLMSVPIFFSILMPSLFTFLITTFNFLSSYWQKDQNQKPRTLSEIRIKKSLRPR